ncbi:MAG: hypothetical protein D6160_17425 [Ketobacter sp.]|nr:MAG: hypothetical protein D6160_17425 [Ketobacter sp.]
MHSGSAKPIVFFAAWVALVAIAYGYFFLMPQQWFDSSLQQPPVLSGQDQQEGLRQLLQKQFPQLTQGKPWFVRMKQSGCQCERFVERYHRSFSELSKADALQVATLELSGDELNAEQKNLLQKLVPATPAVVLFDSAGALSYFGPYHQDGVCNSENSFLEPVLDAIKQGRRLSVLNTLVYGCFCSTQTTTTANG